VKFFHPSEHLVKAFRQAVSDAEFRASLVEGRSSFLKQGKIQCSDFEAALLDCMERDVLERLAPTPDGLCGYFQSFFPQFDALVARAVDDPRFLDELIRKRAVAARSIGLTLGEVEAAVLEALPAETLRVNISMLQVLAEARGGHSQHRLLMVVIVIVLGLFIQLVPRLTEKPAPDKEKERAAVANDRNQAVIDRYKGGNVAPVETGDKLYDLKTSDGKIGRVTYKGVFHFGIHDHPPKIHRILRQYAEELFVKHTAREAISRAFLDQAEVIISDRLKEYLSRSMDGTIAVVSLRLENPVFE